MGDERLLGVVDAQIHGPTAGGRWVRGIGGEPLGGSTAVEASVAAMASVGVDAALLYTSVELSELAYATYPERFRSVVIFDATTIGQPLAGVHLREGDDEGAIVADLRGRAGLVGVRLIASHAPKSWGRDVDNDLALLRGGRYDAVIAAAAEHGLPVCVGCSGFVGEVERLAGAHPGATFVVDHLGMLPRWMAGDETFADLPRLLAMAALPNVVVKLSGLPRLSAESFPFRDVWPVVGRVVEEFGPERCMWGSDYTVSPEATYAESVGMMRSLDAVSERERALLLGGTLRRVFRCWNHDTD